MTLVIPAKSTKVVQPSWAKIGTKWQPGMSAEDLIKAASLDWEVEKRPLFYEHGNSVTSAPNYALVRKTDGKCMSVVSKDWSETQNFEIFEAAEKWAQEFDMSLVSAGQVGDGQSVWILANLQPSFNVFDGDRVVSHLLLTTHHQYGRATDGRIIMTRLVCENGMTRTDSAHNVKLNHRNEFKGKSQNISQMIEIASENMKSYKKDAEFLGSKKASKKSIYDYFDKVFPSSSVKDKRSKNAEAANTIYLTGNQPGAEFAPESWWQGFNTVTYMLDHVIGRNEHARLSNNWYGTNRAMKTAALSLAMELAADS